MVKLEISTHVNRPLADVFNYMTDPAKLPEWNAIVEDAKASETPIRKGTKVEAHARFLGRKISTTAEVIEYEPNKKFVQKSEKPFPLAITNTFEVEGDGTKIVGVIEGEPGGFFKVGESILARILKKQMQAQFDTAKELLEAQVPAAT